MNILPYVELPFQCQQSYRPEYLDITLCSFMNCLAALNKGKELDQEGEDLDYEEEFEEEEEDRPGTVHSTSKPPTRSSDRPPRSSRQASPMKS